MATFFGVFSYNDMETGSCSAHIYFSNVKLDQDIGPLPKGWECCDAYLDLRTNQLSFVKSWKLVNPENPNVWEEDEYYEFPMSDLLSLFWK